MAMGGVSGLYGVLLDVSLRGNRGGACDVMAAPGELLLGGEKLTGNQLPV